MADDLKAIVQRMIDAGESEENIGTVIQHFNQSGAAPKTPPKSLSGLGANAVADVLPAALAVGKGVKDTVLAVGTAMSALSGNPEAQQQTVETAKRLGGGILTAGKAAIADPRGTAQAVYDAAYQHPVQAALTVDPFIPGGGPVTRTAGLVTRTAGRVLRAAAPEAMDMGLARTAAARREFPNAAQRLVDEGLVPFGDKGTQNVGEALKRTEQQVSADAAAWDAAHPNPHQVAVLGANPQRMSQAAQGSAITEGKVAGLGNVPGPEDQEIANLGTAYEAQNTRPRNLSETIAQKRSYQARSRYDNRPNAPTQTNNEVNFNKGIASANRTEAIRMNPPLEGDLSKEQDLLGALTALEDRSNKSMPLSTVGTARSLLGLRNPTVMGTAAVGLDRTGRLLQQLPPELVRAFLGNLLVSHDQQQ